jgi:phosphoglycolate phosphatase
VNRTLELIVFDWDGTLMDSAAGIVRCFERALEDASAPHPGVAVIRHVIGLGLPEAVSVLLPDADGDLKARVVDRYREHFLKTDPGAMELFPGVRKGLEELAAHGFVLAVATGKSRRGLERVLVETGLKPLFAATRCADEAFSKPHPKMLEDILAQTGVAPERALMVGDTVYDLQMACSASVAALAVTYGVHGREALLEHGPVACLDDFEEVCAWLRRSQSGRPDDVHLSGVSF